MIARLLKTNKKTRYRVVFDTQIFVSEEVQVPGAQQGYIGENRVGEIQGGTG